jgi:hypothetical protein
VSAAATGRMEASNKATVERIDLLRLHEEARRRTLRGGVRGQVYRQPLKIGVSHLLL